ncbi:DUF4236 domain-containing protein [Burkholderia pseudomultivorans]|uniref:DUF4236 domain-containing protein n=1 Tax=Burkholderia pseudomultivorans TaxID=1207504 RepID=UPI001581F469|nr:DUF4236 domain-containing protein [Burkholderia pseudomultivorans]
MGFRFRKSIKIAPGIKVNVSKSGFSTSIGGRGSSINIKGDRVRKATVGIPGTGLSYTAHTRSSKKPNTQNDLIPPRASPSSDDDSGYMVAFIGALILVSVVGFAIAHSLIDSLILSAVVGCFLIGPVLFGIGAFIVLAACEFL